MDTLKVVLKDGTEVLLSQFILPLHLVLCCKDVAALSATWDEFTDENLSEVSVMQGDSEIQHMTGVSVTGMQAVYNPDGTLTAHFYMDGTVTGVTESDYITAAKILLGEES